MSRVDKVGSSDSIAWLQARMILVRDLAFVENTDPAWVSRHFLPRLHWPHAEATPLWRARRLPHWAAQSDHRLERRLLGGGAARGCDRIWPLDANARDPDASRNLVMMALESGNEFPDAVEAIRDVVVPYDVVAIAAWLQGKPAYQVATTGHPRAFLRLLNAVLSAEVEAIPPDLGPVLDECLAADASVRSDPAFVHLDALRRRQAS